MLNLAKYSIKIDSKTDKIQESEKTDGKKWVTTGKNFGCEF